MKMTDRLLEDLDTYLWKPRLCRREREPGPRLTRP